MSYSIHYVTGKKETVDDRTEAVWNLGAKYGGVVYNHALNMGHIKFEDDHATVNDAKIATGSSYTAFDSGSKQ